MLLQLAGYPGLVDVHTSTHLSKMEKSLAESAHGECYGSASLPHSKKGSPPLLRSKRLSNLISESCTTVLLSPRFQLTPHTLRTPS